MSSTKAGRNNKASDVKWRVITRYSGLSREQICQLRDLLLAKRRDMIANMTGLRLDFSESGNGGGDSNELLERASELEGAEIAASLYSSQFGELAEIDDALARMADGTYGVCTADREPIGIGRLRARPWARYCIRCARKLEQANSRPYPAWRDEQQYPEDDREQEQEDTEG